LFRLAIPATYATNGSPASPRAARRRAEDCIAHVL
jgi:hypothetical protein